MNTLFNTENAKNKTKQNKKQTEQTNKQTNKQTNHGFLGAAILPFIV